MKLSLRVPLQGSFSVTLRTGWRFVAGPFRRVIVTGLPSPVQVMGHHSPTVTSWQMLVIVAPWAEAWVARRRVDVVGRIRIVEKIRVLTL